MRKVNFKGYIMILLSTVIVSGLFFSSNSCATKLSFGNLTVCGEINQESFEPVIQTDEFDIETKKIYVTIDYYGVKGGDNYRFKWTYLDTGENVLDETLKYSEGSSDYFEGYAMSFIETTDEIKVIPPGNYEVEFYHNGELKSTADFIVKEPRVMISEVILANQVDENYAPVNETRQFYSTEIIYTCVKINYHISGNSLKAKWHNSNGDLMVETVNDINIDLFQPVWVTFTFEGENRDLPADTYEVEIYLNDNMYNTYNFEVSDARAAEGRKDIFTMGIMYTSDKYGVSFALPDNWTFKESDIDDSLEVNLSAQSDDLPVAFVFLASPVGDYPTYDKYGDFADEISSGIAEDNNWKLVDVQENESVTENDVMYNDFIYLFNDPDNTEWALAVAFSEVNDRLYILFGTVMQDYFDMGESVYHGILESMVFK